MSDLSDTPPPEVDAELAKYLDDYEESLRKGLDDYFKVDQQKAWKQKWTADTFDESKVSRDEGGKFGGGGDGDGAVAAAGRIESWTGDSPKNPVRAGDIYKSHEARQQFINDLGEQYGVRPYDKPVAVIFDKDEDLPGPTGKTGTFAEQYKDRPGDTPIAAARGRTSIVLNSDFWGNFEEMQKFEKVADGMFAGNTSESALAHEFGHILDSHMNQDMPPGIETRGSPKTSFYNKWLDKRDEIRKKYFDDRTAIPSMYAEENHKEYAAEAFVAMHFNKGMNVAKNGWPEEISAPYERSLEVSKAYWKDMFQWRADMRKDAERVLRLQQRRREREQKQ